MSPMLALTKSINLQYNSLHHTELKYDHENKRHLKLHVWYFQSQRKQIVNSCALTIIRKTNKQVITLKLNLPGKPGIFFSHIMLD